MKIIVTGGSGLVGQAIKNVINTDKNYKNNHSYLFLSSRDCDLSNYETSLNFFKEHNPDYVIHLAAYVGGLFKNMNHKVDMLEKNLQINYNVVKVCHKVNVKKVICCLSTCIFPDKTTYPIDETMLHNGPPHNSNDTYAYAKRMLEIQCKAYNEQYNSNFVCIIPTNIYGDYDNFSLKDAHVIPALIHKCYLAKQNQSKFIVCGTGKPLRQFIYSIDLAKLILLVLEHYLEKTPIILSVDEKDEVSIATIAQTIAKEFNYEHMLQFDTSFSDGQYKKTANNTKLKKVLENIKNNKNNNNLPQFEFTPLIQGLSKTVKWFIVNYNKDYCRK